MGTIFEIVGIFGMVLLVGFVFLLGVAILFAFIMRDIKETKKYINAKRTIGKVKNKIEDTTINAYGSGVIGMRLRNYKQYMVEYEVQGMLYTGVVQIKRKKQIDEDAVEVRYCLNDETGVPEIVTCMYKDRLVELILGGILGLALVIICIIMEMNGLT